MSSIRKVIAKMLVDTELVMRPRPSGKVFELSRDWFVYTTTLATYPARCLCVLDGVSRLFGRGMRTGTTDRHRGIQFMCRCDVEDEGDEFMQRLWSLIDEITYSEPVEMDDAYYNVQSVYKTSDVLSLGEETETKRYLWTLHARVALKAVETTPLPE